MIVKTGKDSLAESRVKNSGKNAIWGLANRLTTILFPFVTRTIIIYTLGSEYIGLDSLFVSIFQVLNFAEIGFGTAMVYNMYKPIAEGDNKTLCALLNFYKKTYLVIGSIILCVGLGIIPFLHNLISGTYPEDINLYILYLLYLINTVFGYFFYAYKSSVLTAHQHDDIGGRISTVLHVIVYTIQIVVLLLFKNYYIYIIFLPIFTVAFNLIIGYVVDKQYPEYKCEGKIDPAQIHEIKKNIVGLIGYRLEGYALTSVDNIIISSVLGLVSLAYFSNYYYVISALGGLLTACYLAMTASVGNSIVVESKEKNRDDFRFLSFANVWLIGWCTICLICLYQNFITIWLGKDKLLPLLTMVLFAICFFVNHLRRIVMTYRDAAGLWWYDRIRPYLIVVLNIILDFVFINIIGINGILITTISLSLIISIPWEAKVLFDNYLNIKLGKYMAEIGLYIGEVIVAGIITYLLCDRFPNSVWGLVARMMICIIVPNVLLLLVNYKSDYVKRLKRTVVHFVK